MQAGALARPAQKVGIDGYSGHCGTSLFGVVAMPAIVRP